MRGRDLEGWTHGGEERGSSRVQEPPSLLEEGSLGATTKARAGAQSPGLLATPGGLGLRMGGAGPQKPEAQKLRRFRAEDEGTQESGAGSSR